VGTKRARRSAAAAEGADGMPAVVLLVGTEAALRDQARRELRARVLSGKPADFDEQRFDLAAGATPAAILASARTLPVLAPRRLIIVRGLADRRASAFLEAALPAYLEDPVSTTCLLLEAEKVDRRLKWVKEVVRLGEVRDCAPPANAREARPWVSARVAAQGKQIAPAAAGDLIDAVGLALDALASEIDKLCLYVGERRTIESEDVAALTGRLRAAVIFELTDAVGERRPGEAIRILADLLSHGQPPLLVLASLTAHFRRLLRASECSPPTPQVIQQQLRLHPFAARKLADQVRRFGESRLRKALAALRRTDDALKGGLALDPALAIEQAVIEVSR
jgi:DNA polymerase III subunit delta